MHPGMLAELYKRAGINSLWVEISKQARMKIYFGAEKEADVERAAKAELENLISQRNKVAHPSSSPEFPDIEQVTKYVGYLRELSFVLTEVCRVSVAVFNVS
jgi:hypothetical protein